MKQFSSIPLTWTSKFRNSKKKFRGTFILWNPKEIQISEISDSDFEIWDFCTGTIYKFDSTIRKNSKREDFAEWGQRFREKETDNPWFQKC